MEPYQSPPLGSAESRSPIPWGEGCLVSVVFASWVMIGFGLGCALNLTLAVFLPTRWISESLGVSGWMLFAILLPLIGLLAGGAIGSWQVRTWLEQQRKRERQRRELEASLRRPKTPPRVDSRAGSFSDRSLDPPRGIDRT